MLGLVSCGLQDLRTEAQEFLDRYNQQYVELYTRSSEAEWRSNTYIRDGDEETAAATRTAREQLAAFTGSVGNIEAARRFLEHRDRLDPLQVRQFEAMLYEAANNPQTVADLVRERIAAETRQTELLYGFDFKLEGRSVTTNDLDTLLKDETRLPRRLEIWNSSKEVGRGLKEGLVKLRELRNRTVQALGYPDYFGYQASEYGMNSEEILELSRRLVRELWPLYRELHTFARYELARKYRISQVPDELPAHWLPNRWGQDWSTLVSVEGIDLDSTLQNRSPEWIVQQGEEFYVSMGMPRLPASFWEKSSLYPLPPDAGYRKNNHASAWHIDLNLDVRSLMSVIPNAEWYETVHHELGHVYYFLAYSRPEVPPLLREGANRAFHEAVGSLMGLAAMQRPFLEQRGLVPPGIQTDTELTLLKEALNYVVFIPWAGVMTEFEHRLYAENLPPDRFNRTWWELVRRFQGIVPPAPRGEEFCDAATKTHINDDAAQYYDYALSFAILFQLHEHISREILGQDPRATNYFGSREAGRFLQSIMSPGATVDWRRLMQDTLGEEISAEPMLRYFEPLTQYLRRVNQGRTHTLPEQF
jgi:peptidyl-dipeptidase A